VDGGCPPGLPLGEPSKSSAGPRNTLAQREAGGTAAIHGPGRRVPRRPPEAPYQSRRSTSQSVGPGWRIETWHIDWPGAAPCQCQPLAGSTT